jgi:sugar phosphate isomerase/epimerase
MRLRVPDVYAGMRSSLRPRCLALLLPLLACLPAAAADLLAPDNLSAWCIVPFDAKKRGPEDRAVMLENLGIKHLAYDWRDEHIPSFDAEVEAMKRHGIEIAAWWFPASTSGTARVILDCIARHGIHPQLWTMMGDPAPGGTQEEKVSRAAAQLGPVADAAARVGCTLALYNHGGWFGQPENQVAILRAMNRPNAGIVYNLHHGHEHLPRFEAMWREMQPHLVALNLNGMEPDGDRKGRKILALGTGSEEARLLRFILASGWKGPVGILDHRPETDSEPTLRAELEGAARLRRELSGPAP